MTFQRTAFGHHAKSLGIDTNPVARAALSRQTGLVPEDIFPILENKIDLPSGDVQRVMRIQGRNDIYFGHTAHKDGRAFYEHSFIYDTDRNMIRQGELLVGPSLRGHGLGTRALYNQIEVAQEMGADGILMTASRTHGAKTWAPYLVASEDDFNSSFRFPLQRRIHALEPFMSADTQRQLMKLSTGPAATLPRKLLSVTEDMAGKVDQMAQSAHVLGSFDAMYQSNQDFDDRNVVFAHHAKAQIGRDGTLPLCGLLMTRLYYDAYLDVTDTQAVNLIKKKLVERPAARSAPTGDVVPAL